MRARCDTIYVNDGTGSGLRDKIAQFLKQWNGSHFVGASVPISDTHSPAATAIPEPTKDDLESWLGKDSPWLLDQFRRAWGQYTDLVAQKWTELAVNDDDRRRYANVNRGAEAIAFLGWVHHKILDGALFSMSASDRNALKMASDITDHIGGVSTDPFYEQMHAMRSPGQSVDQARAAYQQWVADQLNVAIARERSGNHVAAMTALGMGMHAIMDSYSSAHEGFKEWGGILRSGSTHWIGDLFGGFNPFRLGAAAPELQTYYNTFLIRTGHENDVGF